MGLQNRVANSAIFLESAVNVCRFSAQIRQRTHAKSPLAISRNVNFFEQMFNLSVPYRYRPKMWFSIGAK